MDNLKKDLKELEVEIEKYPLAESPHLIDEFFIMGYNDIIKEKKAINIIKSEISSNNNYEELCYLKEFTIKHLPTIISTISADVKFILVDTQNLISYVFPIPPKIYYCNSEKNIKEPGISKIVFNNIHDEIVNIGYAYSFYEKEIIKINEKDNLIFYFPKAFVILSQYNYFYAFHKICENLHKQYLSQNIEIPLEIQIYNIVNYIPCPLDNSLELSIFPNIDLSSIIKCKNLEEYKKLNKNNFIILEQLGGYKHTELNLCKILDILSPETIVSLYMQIICGKKIAFFCENKERLNFILLVVDQFLFPLLAKESVHCLNPNKYYSCLLADEFIAGFLSSYLIIDFFDPIMNDKINFLIFEDEKSAEENRKGFEKIIVKFDFILDVERGKFMLYEKNENTNLNTKTGDEENFNNIDMLNQEKRQEEIIRNKFLFEYFNNLITENIEGKEDITLDNLVRELYNKLNSLSILIKNQKLNTFFLENEETKNISEQIKEAFLRFNLLISDDYFKKYSKYKGELKKDHDYNDKITKEELGISQAEYYFYKNFDHSANKDILLNLTGGYGSNEPKLQKVSKIGFDNLLATCKADNNNKIILKDHYIHLLDCVFRNEKEKNLKYFSFFEFYKYYNEHLKLFVFNNINDDYLDKKIIKKNDTDNYYYKYKKIILDRDLVLKYCYYLNDLGIGKDKIFPIPILNNIEKIMYSKDYYKKYDKFLIEHKIYNLKNIIQFCILNILILSTSELKLIHFEDQIYSLIRSMNFGIRKYVELILNVSYRISIKKNITNLNDIKSYFDIYEIGMKEKKIFPNNELILLEENINKLIVLLTDQKSKTPSQLVSKIKNMEDNLLFKFTPDKIDKNEISQNILENLETEGKIMKNISLNSDLLNNKDISNDFIYYPYSLYLKLNEFVDKYYISLDLDGLGKNEYHKLIINVIYYLRLIKDEFPPGILQFLFYCLFKNNDEK